MFFHSSLAQTAPLSELGKVPFLKQAANGDKTGEWKQQKSDVRQGSWPGEQSAAQLLAPVGPIRSVSPCAVSRYHHSR